MGKIIQKDIGFLPFQTKNVVLVGMFQRAEQGMFCQNAIYQ